MASATATIDVTPAEGALITAYCLGRIKRDRHCNPLLDKVTYWRAEWMRPQPDACKSDAYENYRLALEAWREERTRLMTTPPQPQKSAAHLAVESLQARVDGLAHENHEAAESILAAIGELKSEVGILRGLIESLSEASKHQTEPTAAPAHGPANGAQYTTFHADSMVMTYDDKGQPSYRAKGGRFSQFGVRVWPEVLPLLKIDPAMLKPGPNPIDITVKAELESKPGEAGQMKTSAKRVVGLA